MTETRVVLSTAPSLEVAESLVSTLVGERLAACGNIVPGVTSIYRWQGRVQRDAEVIVVLKTVASCVHRMTERLVELHPYDVPEALVLPVDAGSTAYLDWVSTSTDG